MRDGLSKLKDFPKESGDSGEVVPEQAGPDTTPQSRLNRSGASYANCNAHAYSLAYTARLRTVPAGQSKSGVPDFDHVFEIAPLHLKNASKAPFFKQDDRNNILEKGQIFRHDS